MEVVWKGHKLKAITANTEKYCRIWKGCENG